MNVNAWGPWEMITLYKDPNTLYNVHNGRLSKGLQCALTAITITEGYTLNTPVNHPLQTTSTCMLATIFMLITSS